MIDKNEKAKKCLDHLFDFLAEPPEDINYVNKALIEEGIDVELFNEKILKLIENLRKINI
jgi:hypothetical protein